MATISRTIRRLGLTRKKIKRVAKQRSEELRENFRATTMLDGGVYKRNMFIFIDEMGFDCRDSRRRFGYSIAGLPAIETQNLTRGKRINAIAAMSAQEIIDFELFDDSVTGKTFALFLRRALLPHLLPFNGSNPNSVIIMDNASIHHVPEVIDLLEGVGVVIRFLPPYSPDLNPIEEVFSKVKYAIKRDNENVPDEISEREAVAAAFNTVKIADCANYISHAGYP